MKEVYPQEMTFTTCVGNDTVQLQNGGLTAQTSNAIKVIVRIDSPLYFKKDIAEGLTRIFQQLTEYFR